MEGSVNPAINGLNRWKFMRIGEKKKLFLIGVSLLFFVGCSQKKGESDEIRPVLTQIIKAYRKPPPLIFSGFSKSQKFINVSFRVGGLIEALPIKVGDQLRKGDLIAQLDAEDFVLRVQRSQAALEESLAEMRKSSAQYKRIKTLYESESASRDELDKARAAYESAKANVEQGHSELNLAKKELDYTVLRADQDNCEVSEKQVEVNENVEAGQPIATLTCGDTLEVEVAVPESEIAAIMQGDWVEVRFNTLPEEVFEGVVREVGVSSSEGAAFPVTISLFAKDDRLRSGMAVKVFFPRPLIDEKGLLIVPIEAVLQDKSGHFVYLFEEETSDLGIARKKLVEIGELLPQGIVIRSGLKPDEEIIIAGLRYLTDGKRVRRLKDKQMFEKKRT